MTFRKWQSVRLALVATLSFFMAAATTTADDSIDAILVKEHAQYALTPAQRCDDQTFLRRVTLDLAGRIPTLDEQDSFRRQPDRHAKIDTLLESHEFDSSWAETWTGMLVGYEEVPDADRESLKTWLESAFQARQSYSQIAQLLISAKGQSALDGHVTFLLRHRDEPAVRVSRVFLGVRLDCARCHDHPFDRWTQQDFESISRFFQGMEVRQVNNQNLELLDRPELTKQVDDDQRPKFFTNAVPRTPMWRDEFALFVTSSKPFARTYANRIWYQLMGRGVVSPPDDFNPQNEPSSRDLLEYLAEQARQQQFDVRAMARMICRSEAYQRASGKEQNSRDLELFATRTIKPMTPEQFVDSMAVSLDSTYSIARRNEMIRFLIGPIDEDFSETNRYRESVQGLMMRLTTEVKSPTRSLDELFVRTLGRDPSEMERHHCQGIAIDDVAYALIHTNEFFFNH